MANEVVFFLHITSVILFSLIACRLGKEALTATIVLQGVLANLFVVKQISLFSFHVTCSDVYVVGSVFALNLLQEFFGKDVAKKVVVMQFFAMAFFALFGWLHLGYTPTDFDRAHPAYQVIFEVMPRILVASISVFFITQQLDIIFFSFLKKTNLPLWGRSGVSLVFSQLVDTLLFSFLGLYGVVENLWDVVFVSFTVKVLIISFMVPFHYVLRNQIYRFRKV